MKKIISILFASIFVSSLAQAIEPQLHQSATYSRIITIDTKETIDTISKYTFIDKKPINNFHLEYFVYNLTTDEEYTILFWVGEHFLEKWFVEDTYELCYSSKFLHNKHHNYIERVRTTAGTFITCRMEKLFPDGSKEIFWLSDEVPFGKVKSYQYHLNPENRYQTIVTELIDYDL